jgi:WD40 repeat protein/predicted Ser/Thr protein kinase
MAKSPSLIIEGYKLVRKLGEGGMGGVYLARQASMDRLVAIKILRKSLARDQNFVERFSREARLAGKLNHPNIVGAIAVGQSGGYHYLVMDYVEGRSLYELVQERGALTEKTGLKLIRQVARALGHAYEHGVIHRDIKPDNILIDTKGVVKLTDLGLAKQVDGATRLTQTGMAMGTPHYVSPEQARGDRSLDIRTDIYSLGATLYDLLTGNTPFDGSNPLVIMNKHLTDHAPWPQDVNPELSDDCCLLIEKMMARHPANRHQDPGELLGDLELVLEGRPPAAPLVDEDSTVPRPGRLGAATGPTLLLEDHRTAATGPLSPVGARHLPVGIVLGSAAAVLLVGVLLGLLFRGGGDASQRVESGAPAREPVALVDKPVVPEPKKSPEPKKTPEPPEKTPKSSEPDWKTQALRQKYYSTLIKAQQKIAENRHEEARKLLQTCPVEMREWEWGRLSETVVVDGVMLKGHARAIRMLALNTDGTKLASIAVDGSLKLWDCTTGKEYGSHGVGSSRGSYFLSFMPDDKTILAGSRSRLLIDASSGRCLLRAAQVRCPESARTLPAILGISYPLKKVLYRNSQRGFSVCDYPTCENKKALACDSAKLPLYGYFSPGGKAVSGRRIIGTTPRGSRPRYQHMLWRVSSGEQIAIAESEIVACFSPDDRLVATLCQESRTVRIMRTDGGKHGFKSLISTDDVALVEFSPKGDMLAVVDRAGVLKVAKVEGGQIILSLDGLNCVKGRSVPVAFSPNGKYLAAAHPRGAALVYDLTTAKSVTTMKVGEAGVKSLRFGPHSRTLAWITDGGTLSLHHLEKGNELVCERGVPVPYGPMTYRPVGYYPRFLYSVGQVRIHHGPFFSPDGKLMLAMTSGSAVVAWDVATGRKTATMKMAWAARSGTLFGFSNGGRTLTCRGSYSTGARSYARVTAGWDMKTGARLFHEETSSGAGLPLRVAAVSRDGTTKAQMTGDYRIRVSKVGQRRDMIRTRVRGSAFGLSADGTKCFTGVNILDMATGKSSRLVGSHVRAYGPPMAAVFGPNGGHLVCVGPRDITAINARTGSVIKSAPLGRGTVVDSQGAHAAYYDTRSKRFRVVDILTGRGRREFSIATPKLPFVPAAFSPDGKLLAASVGRDAKCGVKVWQVKDGKEVANIGTEGATATALAFDARAGSLAIGCRNGEVRFAKLSEELAKPRTRALGKPVTSIRFCARGRYAAAFIGAKGLASGTSRVPGGGAVILADSAAREVGKEVTLHSGQALDYAFCGNGSRLFTAGRDGTIRVWSTADGTEVLQLRTGMGTGTVPVTNLAYSAATRSLVTLSADRQLIIWRAKDWRE